jgi:hypothetical protein
VPNVNSNRKKTGQSSGGATYYRFEKYKALPSFYCENQLNIDLGIGIGHLNWKIIHFGPLDLNIMLVKAIDILPRWGNSSKKILQFKKP